MNEILAQLPQLGPAAVVAVVLIFEARENRKQLSQQNAAHQEQMAKRLGVLENELIQLVRTNTQALEQSASMQRESAAVMREMVSQLKSLKGS